MEGTYFETSDELDFEMFDFENDFEPVARSRSNTWPAPQPENYLDSNLLSDKNSNVGSTEYIKAGRSPHEGTSGRITEGSSRKKKPTRQNPWGNLSYAELISQAINSSENRRLTLSQIYDWMVQNVPFFKNKSESKSSAGWKNSVRHNLSLHNCFIRVPNESQGKSSWWTINPNASLEKPTRRRSASMEAGKLEKKRALAKKQADSLRKKLLKNENFTGSNDSFDIDFQSSVTNKHLQTCFRPRASSCASSFGRLRSIPQIPEEPIWTSTEYLVPVIQQPIQPSQVFDNQECLSSNDQIMFASQNLTEVPSFVCLLHPVGACTCNNPVQINNDVASSSNQDNFVIVNDSDILQVLANICPNNAEMPPPVSLPHKEESDVNYNDYAFVDQVNQAANICVLPRNNSMLDDINEIIKKDECIEIEKVNDSLSTALFISINNNNNLVNYH